jgi:hypothetical protein
VPAQRVIVDFSAFLEKEDKRKQDSGDNYG